MTRGWTIVALATLVACGPRSAARTDVDRAAWLEVTTPHFQITTDVGADDARELARKLESRWYALTGFYNWMTPGRRAPAQQLRVFYLRYRHDFSLLLGDRQQVGGYVTSARDFTGGRIAITPHSPNHGDTIVHELVHIFNAHYLSDAPPWLNEGLATYLETMELDDGQVRFGEPPAMDRWQFGRAGWIGLDELVTADYEAFHRHEQRRNYFAAWKLVHLLNNADPDYHQGFRRYLAALARGTDRNQAWRDAFGAEIASIDRDYRGYQIRRELKIWSARLPLPDLPQPAVRRLEPGDAHAAWLHLLLASFRDDDGVRSALRRQLSAAVDAVPDWPDRWFWTAVVAARIGDSDLGDPIELLRRHLRAHPRDARAWSALVSIRIDRAQPPGYLGTEANVPPALAAVEPDALQLVTHSSTPHELNLIAWYFALAGKARTAQPFALRALAAEPGCGACVDTLALIEYRLGHPKRAAELQRRAMNMMGDGVPDDVLARLRVYEKTAD